MTFENELELQLRLRSLNMARLAPALSSVGWLSQQESNNLALIDEYGFIEKCRAEVSVKACAAPRHPKGFVKWFNELKQSGPGQNDPLFDYLAEEASLPQLRWFISQEVAGEAGFEDLVALTQIRLPVKPKLELARNFWDEMGRGNASGMHGPMLSSLSLALDVGANNSGETVHESLALSNLLVGLAYNRCFAYQSLGALGAIELTAPTRATKVVRALDRLGIDRSESKYFRVHATLDIEHAHAWCEEIFVPLLAANSALATHFAEGALMRLVRGAATFERYRREFAI
jgi:hypothetical protein